MQVVVNPGTNREEERELGALAADAFYDAEERERAQMFAVVCRNLPRNNDRGQARQTVRAELDKHGLAPNDRRFIADWMMSQMGYGGGF